MSYNNKFKNCRLIECMIAKLDPTGHANNYINYKYDH